MEEKIMSIEEIDKHLEKSQQPATRDIASTINDVCKTYGEVRPILVFAKGLLFFKPKWQRVIESLLAVMDKNCDIAASDSEK